MEAAERLARHFVEPLGRRWVHVQAVVRRAVEVSTSLSEGQRDSLIMAAWLHDIGYSPEIGRTGFHPLDGARYLRQHLWPQEVINLVAHHSGARFEADERGLAAELTEFPFEDSPVLDALVTADLTTGPGGESLTYDRRIAEILSRYPKGDPVHQAWLKAGPLLADAVTRTERRLADAHPR